MAESLLLLLLVLLRSRRRHGKGLRGPSDGHCPGPGPRYRIRIRTATAATAITAIGAVDASVPAPWPHVDWFQGSCWIQGPLRSIALLLGQQLFLIIGVLLLVITDL